MNVKTVGLLGGGVIGGGWAARFLLNGIDVQIFDPDPDAARKVDEVLANARRAMNKLVMPALPAEGSLRFVTTAQAAADGADFVQESAPERLELKQSLLAAASETAAPGVVIASSTSGLLPSELQQRMHLPERFVVGHPFNPVYLLPLVEICGGAATSEASIASAGALYERLGMQPLIVRKEVDGFIADRLLEALWREALWLVNDGIATTEEIDDAIRFGAGLRWSFMGTFLTYRIAGGEAGMRHFMEQFGPALQWPWTKLMDVPDLTEELLDRVVTQSDAQANGATIRELESQRDDCLVAVLQGLRSAKYGAGIVLDRYERQLFDLIPASGLDDVDVTAPIAVHEARVPTEWVDYNGHMNDSRFFQFTSEAGDRFLRIIGVDGEYLASNRSYFTVESHMNFIGQASAGDVLSATVQLLHHDEKRLHFMCIVNRDAEVVATAEHMMLHVDTSIDKACEAAPQILGRLGEIATHHELLARPANAGRAVGQGRS